MKTKNVLYTAAVIISILVLISILSIAFFTWPKADDFSLRLKIYEYGILPYVYKSYNDWDGRALSLGIPQGVFMKYLPVEAVNFIWAGCLILSAFVSLLIFLHRTELLTRLNKSDYIIGTAIISSVLWYGFKNHLAETVYWATGGVYIMALLFAVIWIYIWITRVHTAFFYMFTVYVGALTQNLSCPLLIFMVIELIHSVLTKNRTLVKKSLVLIILLFVGLLIISLAPGNFVRSAYGSRSFVINASTLFMSFLALLAYHVRLSMPLFISVIISVPLITMYYLYSSAHGIKKQVTIRLRNNYMVLLLKLSRFFIAAIASILPFVFVPDFFGPRASIYFMAFIFFGIYFDLVPFCLRRVTTPVTTKRIQRLSWSYAFIDIFLLGVLYITTSHMIALLQVKSEILKREQIITSNSNKNVDVVVYPIDKSKLPFSYTFSDITEDTSHWINQAVAKTYNVKSIRVEL